MRSRNCGWSCEVKIPVYLAVYLLLRHVFIAGNAFQIASGALYAEKGKAPPNPAG
jgi:hypothetical protein